MSTCTTGGASGGLAGAYLKIPKSEHRQTSANIPIASHTEILTLPYRIPIAKISVARTLDYQLQDQTASTLKNLRFQPTIHSAPPSRVPGIPSHQKVFVIQDHVATIEVVQAPLRCLMDMLMMAYDSASKSHQLRRDAMEKGGGAPTIFHRPYADSRLFAVVEAFSFGALGMEIGPHWGGAGTQNIVTDYCAINVQAVPPVNTQILDVASKTMEKMLNELC